MTILAWIVGFPYLAYLVVMTALLGLAVIVIGAQAVWVAVRWVLLTALYYVLWPFAWLQQKFTA